MSRGDDVARAWEVVDRVDTDEGALELRRRGDRDFLLTVGGRVLMNSATRRSEEVLGVVTAAAVSGTAAPRVLVGGLGMGLTLRALLDGLPKDAEVVVAELVPTVVEWCRGPLSLLTDGAVEDPRVRVLVGDVAQVIAKKARAWDAVVIDLFEGPHAASQGSDDPFYGRAALQRTRASLRSGGLFAVWGEAVDPAFERRLSVAGFTLERLRPGRGGLRHAVYLARPRR